MNYSYLMKELLDDELYRHSRYTAEAAVSLAEHYGVDSEKAYLAGIVHDYGKRYAKQELINKAEELGLSLDRTTWKQDKLLHAPVGAAMLKKEHKISDPELLNAIAYHTTGRKGMSLFEKIIYLADKIEKSRQFVGLEEIRKIAYTNLDQALLAVVDLTIASVLARGLLLHPRSVVFRNSLLEVLGEKEYN